MASGKTEVLEDEVIDYFLRGQASSIGPFTAWLALYSVAPTDTTTGTELTGNNYGRILAGFTAPSGGTTANAGVITFEASGGAWSEIVAHALMSAETAGTQIYFEDGVTGPTLADGDKYEFGIGDVTASET